MISYKGEKIEESEKEYLLKELEIELDYLIKSTNNYILFINKVETNEEIETYKITIENYD